MLELSAVMSASPLEYYYKNGNEYTLRTGGWGFVTARATPQNVKNPDNIQITCRESDDAVGYLWSEEKIDLTGIKKIEMLLDGTVPTTGDKIIVGIHSKRNNTTLTGEAFSTAGTSFNASFTGQIAEIDVSAITGSWYIGIYVLNTQGESSGSTVMTVYWIRGKRTA